MNIFNDIQKMTNEDIRLQIALFEQINLGNAFKETGNRLMGGLADVATTLVSSFWKNTSFEYEVTKMTDMIMSAYKRLEDKERSELIELLKGQLMQKCGIAEEERDSISEERLTFLIINEAAMVYNAKKNATPANKLECICIEYNKAFLQSLHNLLVKQDSKAVKTTDLKLQQRLNEVSIDVKRDLQRDVRPKEFTGVGIGRVLRLERSYTYLQYVVNSLGKEPFDCVQACIATTFSAIKGLNRISRSMLAQFVYTVKYQAGITYTIDERILPSFVSLENRNELIAFETDFRERLSRRNTIEDDIRKNREAFEKAVAAIDSAMDKLEHINNEYSELEHKFEKLEKQKERYIKKDTSDDAKEYYEDINSTKRNLDEIFAFKQKHENKIAELTEERNSREREFVKLEREFEEIKEKTQEDINKLSLKLMIGWKAFFYRFSFEDEMFEKLVVDFSSSELLKIEEMLKEVHDLKDACAYESSPGIVYCMINDSRNVAIKIENGHISGIDYV